MGCNSGKQSAAAPAADAGALAKAGGQTLLGSESLAGGGPQKKPSDELRQQPAAAPGTGFDWSALGHEGTARAQPGAAAELALEGLEPGAASELALEAGGGPHAEAAKALGLAALGVDFAALDVARAGRREPEATIAPDEDGASPASVTVIQRCRKRKATPWVSPSQDDDEDEEATGLEWARQWILGACCGKVELERAARDLDEYDSELEQADDDVVRDGSAEQVCI